jgi:hypothetical protein
MKLVSAGNGSSAANHVAYTSASRPQLRSSFPDADSHDFYHRVLRSKGDRTSQGGVPANVQVASQLPLSYASLSDGARGSITIISSAITEID